MKTTMTDARAGKRGARRGAWTLNAHCMTGIVAMICSLALAFGSCLLTMMPLTAVADETAAVTGNGSITAVYKNGDAPVAGVHASLYHIANWNNAGTGFDLVKPFSDNDQYPLKWSDIDFTKISGSTINDDGNTSAYLYRQAITALQGLIAQHKPTPLATGDTDGNGVVTFSGLAEGLYLLLFDYYNDGSLSCTASPSMIPLPLTVTNEDGSTTQQMDVTVNAKSSCSTTPTPPTETVKRKVVKVWKNDSDKVRPKKIVLQLLQDGKVYDEVELNESNNWTYEWTDLPAGHDWQVVEKTVPDDYTVLVDRENDVLTITNTYTPPSTPPTTPPETPPTTPPTTPPDTPGTPPDTPGTPPSNNTPPTSTTTTNKPPIGNTGAAIILPAAAAAVLVSVAIIILMRRRSCR
ncbi:Cna B-type domain-containing protein [Bifidobacterium sp. 82T10]|uniref:Cna B-type domain-containing protein n=1 Tax=Bifidobacterium miconis TaxID=2834435 RepID=A0ABS6WHD3_9BIFI|nr:Cna B-type domain-containing protein [Bifidobacterium miconis]MBW3093282.1 Cna B-type domain-containing protein [Bifidobacterium miconis]